VSGYELAQLNIGTIRGPIASPVIAEFVANLDRINALAKSVLWWVPGGHRRNATVDRTASRHFQMTSSLLLLRPE
jgi:hypothetical protein